MSAKIHSLDPEARLVRALGRGSRAARESALRQLMDLHGARLQAHASRMLGDPAQAEDVVQETFLKAWTKAADWTPGQAKFSTWLTRVLINGCLDRLRKTSSVTGIDMDHVPDARPEAEMVVLARERDLTVREAIVALPERQKAALCLSVYDGLSQAEGANVLKVSEKAYESLLVRARRNLRTRLEAQGDI